MYGRFTKVCTDKPYMKSISILLVLFIMVKFSFFKILITDLKEFLFFTNGYPIFMWKYIFFSSFIISMYKGNLN
ncbi:hypothetical protein BAME_21220 [Bacillus sp. M 2-6]|nr:hypothetical protein BAME_21220 [Bacillus sp. M 2-6]